MCVSAALLEPYATAFGKPLKPATDEITATVAPGLSSPAASVAPMILNGATTFVSRVREKSSGVVSSRPPMRQNAAAQMSRSTLPARVATASSAVVSAVASSTSNATSIIAPACSSRSAASASALRAETTTCQPRPASLRASSRPMPLLAPMIQAVPARFIAPSPRSRPSWRRARAVAPGTRSH